MRRLEKINRESNAPITAPEGPIVTLTTFGQRLETTFYAIESIAQGTALPSRITLWVSHEDHERALPASLARLKTRGLEILPCPDYGSHKKYFPEVQRSPDLAEPFITADDDTIYPRYWLAKLMQAYRQNPESIYCFRAHKICFRSEGMFENYKSWVAAIGKQPSHLHFSTGDCGVLFPPRMRKVLHDAGDEFTKYCPKADDIWLNYHAFKSGVKVAMVVTVPKRFYEIPGTRGGALAKYNNGLGGNDIQLGNTYSENDQKLLYTYQQNDTPSRV